MTWFYRHAGLTLSSSMELPEWQDFILGEAVHPVDVAIHRQTAPQENGPLRYEAGILDFTIPNVGGYRVAHGQSIQVMAPPSTSDGQLRPYLLGSAWGALGYQRGWFPLHASVMYRNGQTVAFCAPSGGGKSSLAAWLLAQGWQVFSDDLCRLDIQSETIQVWRSPCRLKLKAEAMDAMPWLARQQAVPMLGEDKYYMICQENFLPSNAPLTAIFLLEWGQARVERLTGLQAVQKLLPWSVYRHEFISIMGLTARYWQHCIQLASLVPIYALHRPKDWSPLPDWLKSVGLFE